MRNKLFNKASKYLPPLLMCAGIYIFLLLFKDKTSQLDMQPAWNSLVNNPLLFAFALMLLVPNWLIETVKWFQLLREHASINTTTAFKSILSGIGLSIFTPNRIGDFGGRLLFVKKENRYIALYITFICSSAQLLTTILMGSFALLYFMGELSYLLPVKTMPVATTVIVVLNIGFLLLFLKLEQFRKIHKWIYPSKRHQIEEFPVVSILKKLRVLFWSLLRYIVFAFQFLIIMRLFGSEIAVADSFFALSLVYLFTSFLPTSIITEVPVRGSVAFFIFSLLGLQAELAAIAFMSMWIINLLIPSVFSLILLKEIKIPMALKTKPT